MIYFIVFFIVFIIAFIFPKYWFPTVEVMGNSMYPTYFSGEVLRSRRVCRFNKLDVGGVYVFSYPYSKEGAKSPYAIKRLKSIDGSGQCFFVGDNLDASYDSRSYGPVHRKRVIARIKGGVTG